MGWGYSYLSSSYVVEVGDSVEVREAVATSHVPGASDLQVFLPLAKQPRRAFDAHAIHMCAHIARLHQQEHAHVPVLAFVQVPSIEKACEFSNAYAPEHLIVNVEGAEALLPQLDNAGSIFMGRFVVKWLRLGLYCMVSWVACKGSYLSRPSAFGWQARCLAGRASRCLLPQLDSVGWADVS